MVIAPAAALAVSAVKLERTEVAARQKEDKAEMNLFILFPFCLYVRGQEARARING